jgi:hypothetical protein
MGIFSKEIHTEIPVNASAEAVWEILTDFGSYRDWNPFIYRIEGELSEGAKLEVRFRSKGGRTVVFRPNLLKVDRYREIQWLGRFMIPGMLDGRHIFEITADDCGGVRFIHREIFTGLLVPLLGRDLDTNTRRGFERMNGALKERAEETLLHRPS